MTGSIVLIALGVCMGAGIVLGIIVGSVLSCDICEKRIHERVVNDLTLDWFEDLEDPEGEWKGELYD